MPLSLDPSHTLKSPLYPPPEGLSTAKCSIIRHQVHSEAMTWPDSLPLTKLAHDALMNTNWLLRVCRYVPRQIWYESTRRMKYYTTTLLWWHVTRRLVTNLMQSGK